ncbi:MAG: glutathione S-transferase family protein [Pseudomonadota bacterium]
MTLTLYGSALSPYVRAVRVTLVEKDLDYEFVTIGPAELQAPEYASLHPFRKLPALDINGEPLFETSAIIRYIDEAHEGKVSLQPVDHLARAHSEQWMSAANSYLYKDIFTGLFFQRSLAPQFGIPVDEGLIATSIEKTRSHISIIADALSRGTLGRNSHLTLGDILVGAILIPLQEIEEGRHLLNLEPKVESWVDNLSHWHSFASTRA